MRTFEVEPTDTSRNSHKAIVAVPDGHLPIAFMGLVLIQPPVEIAEQISSNSTQPRVDFHKYLSTPDGTIVTFLVGNSFTPQLAVEGLTNAVRTILDTAGATRTRGDFERFAERTIK